MTGLPGPPDTEVSHVLQVGIEAARFSVDLPEAATFQQVFMCCWIPARPSASAAARAQILATVQAANSNKDVDGILVQVRACAPSCVASVVTCVHTMGMAAAAPKGH